MSCIHSTEELATAFGPQRPQFAELWVDLPDGQSTCALLNGDSGWMMYLRDECDSGFSSRNPNYEGPADLLLKYVLDNGQEDEYPASWALPVEEVQKALEFFLKENRPAPWVQWHDDTNPLLKVC